MTVSLVMARTLAETVPVSKAVTPLRPDGIAKRMRPFVTAFVPIVIFCRMRDATCQRIGNLQIHFRCEYFHELSGRTSRARESDHGFNKWLIGMTFLVRMHRNQC